MRGAQNVLVARQKRCRARVPFLCAVPRAEAPPRGVFAWWGPCADVPRGLPKRGALLALP